MRLHKQRCNLNNVRPLYFNTLTLCHPASLVLTGDLSKFGRGDASSPAPATTLAQTQQNQTQTHHTTQQPFLNPALPPGYSYTSLPYYTGMPGLPNTFQYGPAVFPVSSPLTLADVLASLTVHMLSYFYLFQLLKESPFGRMLDLIIVAYKYFFCPGGSYLVQAARCECRRQCLSHTLSAS